MADDPRPPDDKETADRNRLPSASIHVTSPHLATHDDAQAYEDLLAALRKDLQLDLATDVIPPLGWNVSAKLWQTAWIPATYQNSWTNAGGNTPAAYLKDPFGFVHLRGRITGGASGTAAFTLPAGYRPGDSNDLYAAAAWNGSTPGAAFIDFTSGSAGQVFIYYAAGFTDLGIGGISFLAEA